MYNVELAILKYSATRTLIPTMPGLLKRLPPSENTNICTPISSGSAGWIETGGQRKRKRLHAGGARLPY